MINVNDIIAIYLYRWFSESHLMWFIDKRWNGLIKLINQIFKILRITIKPVFIVIRLLKDPSFWCVFFLNNFDWLDNRLMHQSMSFLGQPSSRSDKCWRLILTLFNIKSSESWTNKTILLHLKIRILNRWYINWWILAHLLISKQASPDWKQ